VPEFSTRSPAPQRQAEFSEKVPSLRSMSGLLVIECLFTMVGGFMDAYAFIAHGHVFANAQTGNVIFFSVYATEGDGSRAIRHIPPIIACILGVGVAKLLGARSEKHTFRATLLCQCVELVVLSALALFASRLPDAWVVPVMSFVAALRITSFDALGPWRFNSAMTTGNLKSATVGLVLWLMGNELPKNRGKAIVALAACLSFLLGALFGGLYTRWNQEHALVPCVILVFLGIALTWRQHRANENQAVEDL
jgi:uncharacterized membrane protein YoaK (UPF0700 family)